MAVSSMEIGNRELEKIGTYVQNHLAEWIHKIRSERELDLIERVVRVEEELKTQRETTEIGFQAMEKRFDLLQQSMDRQFAAIDQRFEQTREEMNLRFEQTQQSMDRNFEFTRLEMNRRFEEKQQSMDRQFESVEKRLDSFEKRFSVLQWTIGLGFTILAVLMGVFNFF